MKMKLVLVSLVAILTTSLNAQVTLGTIKGTIYNAEDSSEVLPYAKVWVETEAGIRGVNTDLEGRYKIDALKPGTYNLFVYATYYDTLTISEVALNPSGIVKLNAYCGQDNSLPPVIVYEPMLIPGDIPKIEIKLEDIEHSPYIRDPKGLIVTVNSDIQMVEGTSNMIIRGSRPGDAIYYIDGVKATDMNSIPGISIGGMEAYTGGVPAKYGDTTGGVIVLETKSYFDLYNAWKYSQ